MLLPTLLAALLLAPAQDAPAPAPAPRGKLAVFLLAGQSNMEGQAVVDLDHPEHYNGGRGTLARLLDDPARAARFPGLRDAEGAWVERDDVWVCYRPARGARKDGPLSIGFAVYEGRHHFGPELMFGAVVGAHLDAPVLLIKTAWGGKSLFRDFRPPSAGGAVGPCYTQMIAETRDALEHLAERLPALAGLEPELSGFVWFQGWNDMVDADATREYEANLACLIGDVRRELGAPALPVVIGETGNCDDLELRAAQRAAAQREELAGTAAFVPTAAFRRPAEDSPNVGHGHHWFGNAESYLLIGEALGQAMVALLERGE